MTVKLFGDWLEKIEIDYPVAPICLALGRIGVITRSETVQTTEGTEVQHQVDHLNGERHWYFEAQVSNIH